jgi:hypothetical protein
MADLFTFIFRLWDVYILDKILNFFDNPSNIMLFLKVIAVISFLTVGFVILKLSHRMENYI